MKLFLKNWLKENVLRWSVGWLTSCGKYCMHVGDNSKLTINTKDMSRYRGIIRWRAVEIGLPQKQVGILDRDRNLSLQQVTHGPSQSCDKGTKTYKKHGTIYTRSIQYHFSFLTAHGCLLEHREQPTRCLTLERILLQVSGRSYFYSSVILWLNVLEATIYIVEALLITI